MLEVLIDVRERVTLELGISEVKGSRHRLSLYRQFSRFAMRGYDVKVPLETLLERAVKRGRRTAVIYEGWLQGINNGRRFSDVLEKFVPPAERMAISSGEETGQMGQGFHMAAYIVESNNRLRSALVSTLAYPAMLLLVFIALLVFISAFLMPQLSEMLPVEFWPPLSAALYWLSNGLRNFGLPLAVLFGVGAIAAFITLPRWRSPVRDQLDRRLPPWAIYRDVQAGLLLVALSGVVAAGAPIDDALRRLRRTASPWLAEHLDEMISNVAKGLRPARAMETGLMNDTLMDELIAYDRAGDLSDAIEFLGRDAIDLVITRIRAVATVIGTALMFGVGAALVWTWGSFVMVFLAMRAANVGA